MPPLKSGSFTWRTFAAPDDQTSTLTLAGGWRIMLNTLHLPVTLCCATIRPREPIFFGAPVAASRRRKARNNSDLIRKSPSYRIPTHLSYFAAAILNCSNLFTYRADSGVLLTPAHLLTATAPNSRQLPPTPGNCPQLPATAQPAGETANLQIF